MKYHELHLAIARRNPALRVGQAMWQVLSGDPSIDLEPIRGTRRDPYEIDTWPQLYAWEAENFDMTTDVVTLKAN